MLKKTVWLVSILLFAVFVYTAVIPLFNRPPQCVDAPEYCKAILEYANSQMPGKYFELPTDIISWEINEVMILKMEEIPGPHNRKKTTTQLNGAYILAPQSKSEKPKLKKFESKQVFSIGKRYPEGIDVQHIRFP